MSRITTRIRTGLLVLAVAVAAAGATGGRAVAAPTVRTFESDPVGQVPPGCTTPSGAASALVSAARGRASARSLRLDDPSTTTITKVACAQPAQQGGELSFYAYPAALPNGFLVDLLGHQKDVAGTQSVFHLVVDGTGRIRWYDGVNWTQVAPAGTVPSGAWTSIDVRVPSDQSAAHVYVGGRYVGDGGPVGVRALADITGYQFSSDGTPTSGDDVYLDDVGFGPAADAPPPGGTAPFTIAPAGHRRPISDADADAQRRRDRAARRRPARAARLSGARRRQHDCRHAVRLLRRPGQDVGGRPGRQPDAGRGLLQPDPAARRRRARRRVPHLHGRRSGDLKAEVDSSVSHDGGATWTARTGEMTTPAAMRPISTQTDRPGFSQGGFALVHPVVEDPDGTLYQSGYGYYANDIKYRQIVLKSTDGGLNWTVDATVAVNPDLTTAAGYEGFCEGALERVADGSLLIVMRTGSYLPMYVARSTDNGATWSAATPLTAAGQSVVSVYPSLTLLPGGPLVLLVGRPGLALLSSPDGSGRTWTRPVEADYQNSANGVLLPTGPGGLLLFGDRGANWSKPTPAPYEVWSRAITVTQ